MPAVRAFAPAKINLALHVGAPRADGRHELASLAAFCDVGDWVEIEAGPAGIAVSGPFAAGLAEERDNLVMRALGLIAANHSLSVRLKKNLPVASGLGGGSADAAAALRAAAMLLDLRHDGETLERLAARLGSDGPVCMRSRSAIMRGAGEELTSVRLPDLFAILVNPGAPLSTAAVYRRFDERGVFGRLDLPTPAGDAAAVFDMLAAQRNDLEPAGADLAPEAGAALAALRADEDVRLARMSGSGATCFGLAEDAGAAGRVAARLSRAHPHWWVRPTRIGAIDVTPGWV